MTRSSRSGGETSSDVQQIAAELRRQREDLQRQKRAARNSSSETASILEKLGDLRRRSEALRTADSNDETRDQGSLPQQESDREDARG